ncbi:hypothetical protein CICLE_v10017251mg [Citrus x clementina]|uniref:Uncharacterized protein n=1 Tax=Citrus clementina TaxID=85681 RepID=V4TNK9_CITCL|nr:hypothetical protein CICLE_v10017251mg [Citrus x clementina]
MKKKIEERFCQQKSIPINLDQFFHSHTILPTQAIKICFLELGLYRTISTKKTKKIVKWRRRLRYLATLSQFAASLIRNQVAEMAWEEDVSLFVSIYVDRISCFGFDCLFGY